MDQQFLQLLPDFPFTSEYLPCTYGSLVRGASFSHRSPFALGLMLVRDRYELQFVTGSSCCPNRLKFVLVFPLSLSVAAHLHRFHFVLALLSSPFLTAGLAVLESLQAQK